MIGAQLRARLVGVEQHMAMLEKEMANLEKQMTRLEDEKQTIEDDLGALVSPKVSQHKIPTEIMAMIFLEVKNAVRHPYVVLDLFAVCSHWHNIVKSTCHLYTDLLCHHVDQLETYASRAGTGLPLNLCFRQVGPQVSSDSQQLRQLVLQHASQWRLLSFVASIPADLPATFPNLLEYRAFSSEIDIDLPQLDAPRLRHLAFGRNYLGAGWQVKLPWAQITVLEIDNVAFRLQWWKILAETPSLEQLLITGDAVSFEKRVPPIAIIHLPRLHTISFEGADKDQVWQLMRSTTLPALETLKIPLDLLLLDNTVLDAFFERSNCSIRTLELILDFEPDGFLYRFLNAYATHLAPLRELTVRAPAQRDVKELLLLFTDPSFLPALDYLHVNECQHHVPLPPLVRMLSAREKLKTFGLTFSAENSQVDVNAAINDRCREEVDAALKKLRSLRADGLNVYVASYFKWHSPNVDWKMIEAILGEGEEDDESDEERESGVKQDSDERKESGEEQELDEEQGSEDGSDSEDD
ncbi:hypothetical protein FB45DRAFT_1053304 [Roridomyces roridus]|uniref:F-box domain-containing protein n=1 Tax=Roridomyces roridus TaxID=1738132 RepID=A0AAD7CBT6_9AGAR|nr:hypothetical protein FB45DRAFT_1053304 [Roridomyces roridus]